MNPNLSSRLTNVSPPIALIFPLRCSTQYFLTSSSARMATAKCSKRSSWRSSTPSIWSIICWCLSHQIARQANTMPFRPLAQPITQSTQKSRSRSICQRSSWSNGAAPCQCCPFARRCKLVPEIWIHASSFSLLHYQTRGQWRYCRNDRFRGSGTAKKARRLLHRRAPIECGRFRFRS